MEPEFGVVYWGGVPKPAVPEKVLDLSTKTPTEKSQKRRPSLPHNAAAVVTVGTMADP